MATNDLLDQCGYAPTYQTFFVDETLSTFHVYATGTSLTIVVNGPSRRPIQPSGSWNYGNTYIQRYDNADKGNYLVTVQSVANPPGPCAYRVIGNANTNAFIATASSLNTDMNTPYGFNPIYSKEFLDRSQKYLYRGIDWQMFQELKNFSFMLPFSSRSAWGLT